MPKSADSPVGIPDQSTREFYLRAMDVLEEAKVPYVVGGGYAMASYTGIPRDTKDLDVFVRPQHRKPALRAMERAGYRTEMTWPHFLAKALHGEAFVDILYASGNGLCCVDDEWFKHAVDATILGRAVKLGPPEEIIWSKGFVQDRHRFDGADIIHLILARGHEFNWDRLMRRFKTHERVLLAHLILFGYVYPSEREIVPEMVIEELLRRIRSEPPTNERICNGTLLSQVQFLWDIQQGGFIDARLKPFGPLTAEEIASITP